MPNEYGLDTDYFVRLGTTPKALEARRARSNPRRCLAKNRQPYLLQRQEIRRLARKPLTFPKALNYGGDTLRIRFQ